MKKTLVLFIACAFIFALLCACETNNVQVEKPSATAEPVKEGIEPVKENSVEEAKTVDLPYGSDIGTGNMYLACASGTTENGNVIDVLVQKDTYLKQIGINAFDFDGSYFSFVYIDGVFVIKEQYANSQGSLDLVGDSLSEGIHTVSVVQYDNNEETGNIITYKEARYKIVL